MLDPTSISFCIVISWRVVLYTYIYTFSIQGGYNKICVVVGVVLFCFISNSSTDFLNEFLYDFFFIIFHCEFCTKISFGGEGMVVAIPC